MNTPVLNYQKFKWRFFIILIIQVILILFFFIFSIVQKQDAERQRIISNKFAEEAKKEAKINLELREELNKCREKQ